MGQSLTVDMTSQEAVLRCGSKTGWIVLSVACIVIAIVLFIVAGSVGGCDCIDECTTSCSQLLSGCKKPTLCKTGSGMFSYGVTADGGQTVGAALAEIGFGVLLLIMGIIFTCGICACGCFGKPAGPPGFSAPVQVGQPVVTTVMVQGVQPTKVGP